MNVLKAPQLEAGSLLKYFTDLLTIWPLGKLPRRQRKALPQPRWIRCPRAYAQIGK